MKQFDRTRLGAKVAGVLSYPFFFFFFFLGMILFMLFEVRWEFKVIM